MGCLSVTHKLCISICLGFLVYTAAERQYFTISHNTTWEQARNHCQVCYKEMVTLTPENTHIVSKMANSDHWIGLRKYINYKGTSNNDTPWTGWANGDPLFFQNWYPGWPVFKSPLPKIDCCSCSCTCPVLNSTTTSPPARFSIYTGSNTASMVTSNTEVTSDEGTSASNTEVNSDAGTSASNTEVNSDAGTSDPRNTTSSHSLWSATPQPPVISTCERAPMWPPIIPENNKNYIENSCVVILRFGPWVEKECSEKLPSICYEDRFMGSVTISNITASSAALMWEKGPGDISSYRLVVLSAKGDTNITKTLKNLSYDLEGLIAGTGYDIQVFPVKCGRDLNPQNGTFYTIPGKVENLTVTNYTETTVTLIWKKPEGNYGFFKVTAHSNYVDTESIVKDNITAESLVFDGLTQGNNYTFFVTTGVEDRTRWSDIATISECTSPSKVSKLEAFDNSDTHLKLKWEPPEGNYTGFEVKAMDRNLLDLQANVTYPKDLLAKPFEVEVKGLPNGKQINFNVTAISICKLNGATVHFTTYTAPGPVSNLTLAAGPEWVSANWSFDSKHGEVSNFTAVLSHSGHLDQEKNITAYNVTFKDLKTATRYTVDVYAVTNNLRSPKTTNFIFTSPSPPTDAKVLNSTKDCLNFTWTAPKNSSAREYICNIKSDFWNTDNNKTVNETHCKFTGLKSGSTYNFQVFTLSDNTTSQPAKCSGTTVEDPVEIDLSMLCSSEATLHCDKGETRDKVFDDMKTYFEKELGQHVYYKLQKGSST
ncbi:receptor-type tyrosine-protein phosphatase eta [Cyprinodon tularosa]|uniref:receptor-type tyrosine-protein phosphatase eta n=1 Tax=Cyprinodon tularosa TaxID=77115 RepID=UPI0018E262AF|nr:receptor-type tyrosine-protein phosphatase eta [Cyprinodon tularosa]